MANTRQSAKRAGQSKKRQVQNNIIKRSTNAALKKALGALESKDTEKLKEFYKAAIKSLDKAASKGTLPRGRASRKIARLTAKVKATAPEALPFK